MSTGNRNRAWPLAIALSVAVVGVLAAFIVMAVQEPAPATAHGPDICHTPFAGLNPECAAEHPHTDGTDTDTDTDTDTGTDADTPAGAMLDSSSTSANATVELTFTSLPLTAADVAKIGRDGGSVELFLEDQFVVPGSISPGSIYFTLTKPTSKPNRRRRTGTRRLWRGSQRWGLLCRR